MIQPRHMRRGSKANTRNRNRKIYIQIKDTFKPEQTQLPKFSQQEAHIVPKRQISEVLGILVQLWLIQQTGQSI